MLRAQTEPTDLHVTTRTDAFQPGPQAPSRVVVVRVPGSGRSPGNRGAAVANDRWLTATFTLDESNPRVIERTGALRDLTVAPSEDRMLVAFRAACIRAGRTMPAGLRIRVSSDVDVGRGLGASAAAAVAGAVGARALLDLPLDDFAIISAASTADGSIAQVVASFDAHTAVVPERSDAPVLVADRGSRLRPHDD